MRTVEAVGVSVCRSINSIFSFCHRNECRQAVPQPLLSNHRQSFAPIFHLPHNRFGILERLGKCCRPHLRTPASAQHKVVGLLGRLEPDDLHLSECRDRLVSVRIHTFFSTHGFCEHVISFCISFSEGGGGGGTEVLNPPSRYDGISVLA